MTIRQRLLLFVSAAILMSAALLASASGATRHDRYPLRVGSAGANVCQAKYLLRDPRPKQNVFTKIKGTYKGAQCARDKSAGYFGKAFGKSVVQYKYRLGYPKAFVKPVVGRYFIALLRGKKHRPATWIALAATRLKATEPGVSPMAQKIRTILQSQLGTYEYPYGSNRGPKISFPVSSLPSYQSTTGAYGAAWCVSFTQWVFKQAGYGYFADRTAGVFYAVGWANRRGYLHARPKVGSIVAFMEGQGHMGTVVKITASGFVSIEGNASNRVLERYHWLGDRRPVFIYLPGVA